MFSCGANPPSGAWCRADRKKSYRRATQVVAYDLRTKKVLELLRGAHAHDRAPWLSTEARTPRLRCLGATRRRRRRGPRSRSA